MNRRPVLLALALALLTKCSVAQFLPPMQAALRDEFDAYLDVLEAESPTARAEASSKFEATWPGSELLPHIYQVQAEALRSLGNGAAARAAAERAIRSTPDHVAALVLLAEIISNDEIEAPQLKEAENHARRALTLIGNFRVPRSVPLAEWEEARDRMRSRIHAALGLASFKRNEVEIALREFEAARALAPQPDAVVLYRLGKLYRELGRGEEAATLMKQVAQMDEPTLRRLAEVEIQALKKAVGTRPRAQ